MSIPYSAKKQQAGLAFPCSPLFLELVLGSQLCQQAGLLGQQALPSDMAVVSQTRSFFNDPLAAVHTTAPQLM